MAKITLNSAIDGVSGSLDKVVFKHYRKDKRGQVMSRKPDMSKVTPSPARLARRKLMREAGLFHRQVLVDPVLLEQYQAIAQKQGINLSAATIGEFLRRKSPQDSFLQRGASATRTTIPAGGI